MDDPMPWASTTIKIIVDPISMIKTLGEAMVVLLTPIVF